MCPGLRYSVVLPSYGSSGGRLCVAVAAVVAVSGWQAVCGSGGGSSSGGGSGRPYMAEAVVVAVAAGQRCPGKCQCPGRRGTGPGGSGRGPGCVSPAALGQAAPSAPPVPLCLARGRAAAQEEEEAVAGPGRGGPGQPVLGTLCRCEATGGTAGYDRGSRYCFRFFSDHPRPLPKSGSPG